jgi:hypothetical protein
MIEKLFVGSEGTVVLPTTEAMPACVPSPVEVNPALAVTVVKAPLDGVVPPMAPGLGNEVVAIVMEELARPALERVPVKPNCTPPAEGFANVSVNPFVALLFRKLTVVDEDSPVPLVWNVVPDPLGVPQLLLPEERPCENCPPVQSDGYEVNPAAVPVVFWFSVGTLPALMVPVTSNFSVEVEFEGVTVKPVAFVVEVMKFRAV